MNRPKRIRGNSGESRGLLGKPTWMAAIALATILAIAGLTGTLQHRADAQWAVGELRDDGLRIIPSGRSDNSAVLDPRQFVRPEVQRAYAIAYEIPEVLNQLYCWCGCENRGVHRSNLGCYEDEMSVNCDVCRGTANIAYEMVQEGVTDTGEIQAAVDAEWAPENRSGWSPTS